MKPFDEMPDERHQRHAASLDLQCVDDYLQLHAAQLAGRRPSRGAPTQTPPHKRTYSCKYPSTSSVSSGSRTRQLARRRESARDISNARLSPRRVTNATTTSNVPYVSTSAVDDDDTVQQPSQHQQGPQYASDGSFPSSASHSRNSSWKKSRRPSQPNAANGGSAAKGRGVGTGGALGSDLASSTGSTVSCGSQPTLDDAINAKLQQLKLLEQVDCCVVRCFDTTPKGIVNRGDSFKHKRVPVTLLTTNADGLPGHDLLVQPYAIDVDGNITTDEHDVGDLTALHHSYTVLVIGDHSVGRTALLQQFMTSQYLAAQTNRENECEKTVSVLLDGEETTLNFVDLPHSVQKDCIQYKEIEAYLVVYSMTDRHSFRYACDVLRELRHQGRHHDAAIILVGNKSDLVRCRQVTDAEGRSVSQSFGCKHIQVSAVLNHRIDDLLAGLVHQIRLNPMRHNNTRAVTSTDSGGTYMSTTTGCFTAAKHFFIELINNNRMTTVACDNLWVL